MTYTRQKVSSLPERLSALETELLTYVEELVWALEHSREQFNRLEKHSTEQIEQRLQALEGSVQLLAASQVLFLSGYRSSGTRSSVTIPDELSEILSALQDIAQTYEMKPATR